MRASLYQSRLLRCSALTQSLATAYLLALALVYGEAATTRSRNGVRLVGGTYSKGRLEVSSKAWWLLGPNGAAAWRPVCDENGLVDDRMAKIMCVLLGFEHGRRYYKHNITYRKPNGTLPYTYDPIGYLQCKLRSGYNATAPTPPRPPASPPNKPPSSSPPSRRLRSSGEPTITEDDTLGSAAASATSNEGVQSALSLASGSSASRRSLLTALYGSVDIPTDAPYSCAFRLGDCRYTGPLVGIQCSHHEMPPAPPPPPSPPHPPPAPPPGSLFLRLYGGGVNSLSPEHNLCPSADYCNMFGRLELLVDAPSGGGGGPVWAPLCSTPSSLTFNVAQVACYQAFDLPRFAYRPEYTAKGQVPSQFFRIPDGSDTLAAGDFNPANYTAWVTITGGRADKASRLQDFELQVSNEPCGSKTMFAVACRRQASS